MPRGASLALNAPRAGGSKDRRVVARRKPEERACRRFRGSHFALFAFAKSGWHVRLRNRRLHPMSEGPPKDHWKRKLCLGNEPPVWFDGALFLVGSFGGIIFLSAVFTLMRTILFSNAIEDSGDVRGLAFIIFGLIGLPFVIWRAIVAQGNLDRSKDRDYADLFTKAVEQLGATREEFEYEGEGEDRVEKRVLKSNIEVRLGAIYALERISQDSERDHISVMETLCAYVRENASAENLDPSEVPFDRAKPKTDIQAAITVLGRRPLERKEFEWQQEFRLDISSTDLSGVDFRDGDFTAAILVRSRLEAASFRRTILAGTQFHGSLMNFADFFDAKLRGTFFDHCIFSPTKDFSLAMGNIQGISVVGADLGGLSYLGNVDRVHKIFGSKDTQLQTALNVRRNAQAGMSETLRHYESQQDGERVAEYREKLAKSPFGYWFEHSSDDMALGMVRKEFFENLGLTGWPYQ